MHPIKTPVGYVARTSYYWGEHERAPHRRAKRGKICMCLSLTQISLTTIMDFRAVCKTLHLHLITHALAVALARNQTAESQVKALGSLGLSALRHNVATSIANITCSLAEKLRIEIR